VILQNGAYCKSSLQSLLVSVLHQIASLIYFKSRRESSCYKNNCCNDGFRWYVKLVCWL